MHIVLHISQKNLCFIERFRVRIDFLTYRATQDGEYECGFWALHDSSPWVDDIGRGICLILRPFHRQYKSNRPHLDVKLVVTWALFSLSWRMAFQMLISKSMMAAVPSRSWRIAFQLSISKPAPSSFEAILPLLHRFEDAGVLRATSRGCWGLNASKNE